MTRCLEPFVLRRGRGRGRGRGRAASLAAFAFVAGCAADLPPPAIDSVSPSSVRAGDTTELTVRGRGFYVRYVVDYAASGDDRVDDAFAGRVVASDGSGEPLDPVRRVSDGEVRATMPARALAPGRWDVEITDPFGRTARSPTPLQIVECFSDEGCDDGLWCDGAETCVAGRCARGEPPCVVDQPSCLAGCDEAGTTHCRFTAAACDDGDPTTPVSRCDSRGRCLAPGSASP